MSNSTKSAEKQQLLLKKYCKGWGIINKYKQNESVSAKRKHPQSRQTLPPEKNKKYVRC